MDDFISLMRRVWRTRAYGDFWSYMLVAEGAVDLAAEPELNVHDMAAVDVIVREAGVCTSLSGENGPWAATRSPPTATCTTRRCRSWARWPTATTTGLAAHGPGSVSELRPAAYRPEGLSRARGPSPSLLQTGPAAHRRSHAHRRDPQSQARRDRGHDRTGRRRTRPALAPRRAQRRRADRQHRRESLEGIVSERDVVRHLHTDGTVVNNTVRRDHDRARRDVRPSTSSTTSWRS